MKTLSKFFLISIAALLSPVASLKEGDEGFDGVNCTLSAKGFYGVREKYSMDDIEIDYFYEFSYDDEKNVDQNIIDLDRFVGQQVLQLTSWFDSCQDNFSSARSFEFNVTDDFDVLAVSTRPHDKKSNKQCTKGSSDKCTVIEGSLTIFFQRDSTSVEQLKQKDIQIKQIIKELMKENEEFDDVYSNIAEIKYLTKDTFEMLPIEVEEETDEASKSPLQHWKFVVGFLSAFAALSILLIFLNIMKWKQAKAMEPKARFNRKEVHDKEIS